MTDGWPDDDLRVGHPERERAIAMLNDAFSSGYLDVAEFEERSGVIYAARTRGDLRQSLHDLPIAGQLFPDAALAQPTVTPVNHPDQVSTAPVEYDANWETVRRKGVWQVPPNMLITGSMGTVDFDFTNATFPVPLVTMQLQVSATTVKVRVGPNQEVRYDGLKKSGWSTVKDKAGSPERPGGEIVVLAGSVSAMCGVTIRRS